MKIQDIIILGAGASGLMCAGNVSSKKSVAIIEKNSLPARKLKISGGGKCNITNEYVESSHFDGDTVCIEYILKKFSKQKLLDFVSRGGVALELRKGRYYFCKNSAEDIINLLKIRAKHAHIYFNEDVVKVEKKDELFYVQTRNTQYCAKKIVVATGGKSFQNIGASDIGLKIAKDFNLEVQEFSPALVGLTVQQQEFWMKELSGLSCYVHIKVGDKMLQEEMLFTHKGLSGPAVLSASLFWKKGVISIDFLPNKSLDELLQGKKLISSALPLPKRLAKMLLKVVHCQDKACDTLTKKDKEKLAQLHQYSFAPAGTFGFSKAEVSRGGVACCEIDFKTMEAKKVKNLYFIGEVVDVTGELGGYNFQWAFSSAYVCAKQLSKKI